MIGKLRKAMKRKTDRRYISNTIAVGALLLMLSACAGGGENYAEN